MSTNDARRKVGRLLNECRPPHSASFLSRNIHPQSLKPIYPWAWTYSRLSQWVELDQGSGLGVHGMQPYLAFKDP